MARDGDRHRCDEGGTDQPRRMWQWCGDGASLACTSPMLRSGRCCHRGRARNSFQPRKEWFSLAINGFNGRGQFVPSQDKANDGKSILLITSSHGVKSDEGYALLIGQVPGDAALHGLDIVEWAQKMRRELIRLGHKVVYRPHPKGITPCPEGAELSTKSLDEDLAGASRVVVYNSTTAVGAVLAGIPTVTMDIGSVAYPMASHDLSAPLVRPLTGRDGPTILLGVNGRWKSWKTVPHGPTSNR